MPGTVMLATFSRDWASGEIRGLQEIAERLRALDEYVTAAAQTIDSLVAKLSRIESALESEAYLAAMDGVHTRAAAAEQLCGLYQKRMASVI